MNIKIRNIKQLHVKNSFFEESYKNTKILIIIPHQDDEVFLAANTIINFAKQKADIYVVYTTNGDWKTPAYRRYKEALEALKTLGVKKENIIFLGYPDGGPLNDGCKHIFNYNEGCLMSYSNKKCCYGAYNINDYNFVHNNFHSSYNKTDYCRDLKNVIFEIKADLIICSDFDEHPDHRMLSLVFDDVIGQILKLDKVYKPIIWKGFAYCANYTAKNDFFSQNIKSTPKPQIGITEKYSPNGFIDHYIYNWQERIRIPIRNDSRRLLLPTNIIANALAKHKSQSAVLHSGNVINGDNVFWQKRTDSLSYSAKIKTSSGNSKYLNDFKFFDASDLKSEPAKEITYCWEPDCSDQKKQLAFIWQDQQEISIIQIFGNQKYGTGIKKIKITFDNNIVIIKEIEYPNYDLLTINIPPVKTRRCILELLETNINCYISECLFFKNKRQISFIKPFIKICIEDEFVYDYWITPQTKNLKLKLYKFNTNENIILKLVSGNARLVNETLYIYNSSKNIVIRAFLSTNPDIYDEVTIKTNTLLSTTIFKTILFLNKVYLFNAKISKYLLKARHLIKRNGFWQTIKKYLEIA